MRKKIALKFFCFLLVFLPCTGMEWDKKNEEKNIFLNQNYFKEDPNEAKKIQNKEYLNLEKKHKKRRKKKKNNPTGANNCSLHKSTSYNNVSLIQSQEKAYENMASPMRNYGLLPAVSQEASGFEDVFGCQLPNTSLSYEKENSFEETHSSSQSLSDSQEPPKVNEDFKSQRRTPEKIKAIKLEGKKAKLEKLMKK